MTTNERQSQREQAGKDVEVTITDEMLAVFKKLFEDRVGSIFSDTELRKALAAALACQKGRQ